MSWTVEEPGLKSGTGYTMNPDPKSMGWTVSDFVDIYGWSVISDRGIRFGQTCGVPTDADPKESPEYLEALALCARMNSADPDSAN